MLMRPRPSPFIANLDSNPTPAVAHGQLNLIRHSAKFHSEVPHTTVLDAILQGLLQNPEKTKRDFLGQSRWDIGMAEVNLHFLVL